MSLGARHSPDYETRQGSFRIDEAALSGLGLPQPVAVAVPANTLVVADTFGFHARALSLKPSLRVEVWGIGQRAPFLPWRAIDDKLGTLGAEAPSERDWRLRTGLSMFDGPSA